MFLEGSYKNKNPHIFSGFPAVRGKVLKKILATWLKLLYNSPGFKMLRLNYIKIILFLSLSCLLFTSNVLAVDHGGQAYTTPISSHQYHVGTSSGGISIWYGVANTTYGWVAQNFVAPKDFYLGKVELRIRNVESTTDYITVEIRNDNGFLRPDSKPTPALYSITANVSTTTYHWHEFFLDNPPKLISGATYWICVESTNTSQTDGYGWWLDVGVPTATVSLSDEQGYDWDEIGAGGDFNGYYRAYEFLTIMNTSSHTITANDGKTKIKLPPFPFGNNSYYIVIDTNPAFTSQIIAANIKADNSDDRFFMPVDSTLRDIKVYKGNPLALSHDDFSSDVELTIPYKMDGNYVKGTSPPVREETLAIYWLNEDDSIWVKIPGSVVDTSANTVTAKVNHFSIYTLMGVNETNLSGAYAYPVPFIANSPENHTEIKFTGLSSQATIKVYTLSGELVQTIEEVDGDGSNDTLDVDKFSSGVYLYYIFNAEKSKSGQLVIIK